RDACRALPDSGLSRDLVRRGIDLDDVAGRLVGDPDEPGADGDPAPDGVRVDRLLDLTGLRVDARDGAVVGVRHPDRAVAVYHGGGSCARTNLHHFTVRF